MQTTTTSLELGVGASFFKMGTTSGFVQVIWLQRGVWVMFM
jgi:hypothetical protein